MSRFPGGPCDQVCIIAWRSVFISVVFSSGKKVFKVFHHSVIVQGIDGYVLVIKSSNKAEAPEVGPPTHGPSWSTCSLFVSALLSPEN